MMIVNAHLTVVVVSAKERKRLIKQFIDNSGDPDFKYVDCETWIPHKGKKLKYQGHKLFLDPCDAVCPVFEDGAVATWAYDLEYLNDACAIIKAMKYDFYFLVPNRSYPLFVISEDNDKINVCVAPRISDTSFDTSVFKLDKTSEVKQ